MTDIAAQNRYIANVFTRLPQEKAQSETHELKKGENLWSIAKKALGQNARKGEINDYMLRIAKLNGFNTYEKMNNIKIGTAIFMPETKQAAKQAAAQPKVTKQAAKAPVKQSAKPASVQPAAQNTAKVIQQPVKSDAEKSTEKVISTILNDDGVFIEKPRLSPNSTLYHAYIRKNDGQYQYNKHNVMSFNMDESGKLIRASFENLGENLNTYGHDYYLDRSGRIYLKKYNTMGEQRGRISPEAVTQLEQKLAQLITKATHSY